MEIPEMRFAISKLFWMKKRIFQKHIEYNEYNIEYK